MIELGFKCLATHENKTVHMCNFSVIEIDYIDLHGLKKKDAEFPLMYRSSYSLIFYLHGL